MPYDRFADEPSILRYIKIAATLRDKTVRDVALRCRWMTVSTSILLNTSVYYVLDLGMNHMLMEIIWDSSFCGECRANLLFSSAKFCP